MLSEEFLEENQDLFEAINDARPGFWSALGNELERVRNEQVTTRGAVVREILPSQDASTQTVLESVEASAQTTRVETRDQPTQTGTLREEIERKLENINRELWNGIPMTIQGDPAKPVPLECDPTWTKKLNVCNTIKGTPRGCWNCASREHRVRDCPLPIAREYCYRCGRGGCTVKTCPKCGRAWRAQGPYIPGKRHPGPSPPKGSRKGTRRPRPY